MIRDPKIVKYEERTQYLRDNDEPHGFKYVRQGRNGQYFCKVGKINTGLHPTPLLAAFVLDKLAKLKKVDLTVAKEDCHYPEFYTELPFIDYDAIKYLRHSGYKSGYLCIRQYLYRGKPRYSFRGFWNGVAYRSDLYDTPGEAAWALHTGENLRMGIIRDYEEMWSKMVPFNMFDTKHDKAIQKLANPSLQTGYHYVRRDSSSGKFFGVVVADGICELRTPNYALPQEAAWAVLHMQKHVAYFTRADLEYEQKHRDLIKSLREEAAQALLETRLEPVFVDFSKE